MAPVAPVLNWSPDLVVASIVIHICLDSIVLNNCTIKISTHSIGLRYKMCICIDTINNVLYITRLNLSATLCLLSAFGQLDLHVRFEPDDIEIYHLPVSHLRSDAELSQKRLYM